MDEHARGQGKPSTDHGGAAPGPADLASRLSELARSLEQEDDPAATLAKLVEAAVQVIPGVDEGSVSVVTDRRQVHSQAASSELATRIDSLQVETGEGPCLDAVYEQQTVRVADMRTEDRWPRFARRASEEGVGSLLAFQLYVEGDNLGALNLYARHAGAFDDESEHVGLVFAAHAAVAYAGTRKIHQLTQAIATRDLIGQAKGILMERYGMTGSQAFQLMIRVSQDTNRKLRDVADALVSSGELTGHRR